MAKDNKRPLYTLYESLKNDDYDVPDNYESFERTLTAKGDEGTKNRMTLYNSLKSNNYDVPDTYESFANTLFIAPTPKPAAEPKATQYFKLRRGGKDFTVSTDEVNAAGGLSEWAKTHPGAPVRVYMQGKKEDGSDFSGHVDLASAQERRKSGYKYTTTHKVTPPAQPQKPWKPTMQEKMAMSHQLDQMQSDADQIIKGSRERTENMTEYYRNSNGLDSKAVESKPVVDPKTGKLNKTYVTPTGERTTNRAVADMATYNHRQAMAAADMSVGAQIRRAQAELEELHRKANKRGKAVAEASNDENSGFFSKVVSGMQMAHGTPLSAGTGRALNEDQEFKMLSTAIRQKEEQLKNLIEERDRQAGKDVGFWRGFGRVAGDQRTWDFGVGDLSDAMNLKNSDKAVTAGEKKAAQEMLKSAYDKEQTEQMYGDNASFWNRAGIMTGYMPSFMLDFAMTGGGFDILNMASKAATKGSAKFIGKEALKEMGELGVKEYAKKYGVRGVGRMAENWTIKALGTTADDLLIRAPLMTNTVQAGKTAADIVDRKLGNVLIDENGNYDFSNDKSWGSAVWQGEANAIIENYSEMFGTHLDGFIPTLAKTFGGKRISGMLARANASSFGQILSTTRKQFESLGVSDYLGEVSEEYYGQLWRTMLNLDDAYHQNPDGTRTNLLFTGQFHGDIWGGMALSMGLMGAGKYSISGIAYGNMKHQVNKADKKAAEIFTPDRWEPLRELIDNTTNEDIGVLAENMVNDQNLSDDERSAVMGYMESSLNLRGLNLGAMAKTRGTAEGDEALHENIEVDSELSQSYIDGYEASSPQEMNDSQNMYEFHRQHVEGMFQSDILDWFDRDPITALIDMSRNGIFSQEEIDAARDYINAKTVRDGMIQRVNDDIDEQIAQSDAMIGGRVNQATGMIQPALMGLDDREVYVVGGFLAINEDGTIDRDASDESIVIRDAVTGELEFTDPKSIVSAMAEIDPDAYKAEAAETIRQQAAQTAADAINGTLSFNPGDVITMDNNGSQATVLGPAIDQETGVPVEGQVIVQLPDGSQSVLSKEELQEMSDAANLERLNSFEQERAAQRAQQEAQKAEAMRPQFKLNDEFTILGENGTPIRGSITREVDEDGLVEIYTEEPLNDKNVNRISPTELEGMFDTYNGEPMATTIDVPENAETVPNSTENPEINSAINENPAESTTEAPQSALSRIPTDEEGEPLFEQTDAATAWDGLTEYFGDADDAIEFARSRVQSLKKEAEKLTKAVNDVRTTGSPKEFKEAKAKARAELAAKKAQLDHWNGVVNAKIAKEQAEAEAKRQADEADREEKRQAYLAAEAERRQQEEARKAEIEAAKEAEESARVEAEKKAAIEAVLPASREKANAAKNFESYFDALKEEAIKEGGVSTRDSMADKIANAKGGKQYSEVYEALSQESAPATLEEYLARMLSLGGTRVQWSGAHNLGGEVFGREKVGERPEYRWMTSDANGVSFPQFIHSLWESLTKDGNIGFNVDEVSDQDVRNAVVDLLREHPTSRSLFEHAIDLHDNRMQSELLNGKVAELEHYADEIKDEWYKENYGLTAAEYESYVENVYKEIEEQGLTDEDILALDEMIADEYAAKQNQTNIENNGTESRQSTDDTENQSGDAILPSTPTDRREGASGDVEAQPEETGRDSNSEDGAAQTEAEIDPDLSPKKDPEQTTDAVIGAAIAAAEAEVNTDPTEAQKEAGNYRKGHVKLGKFDVTIEQPAGSVRRGTDANGKKWETTMQNTYGYIRGTEGVDGDHIDVFLSNNFDAWDGQRVVIVDQYNPDGSFDEHKVMLGFNDKADAINAYLANYENGWENSRKLVYSSATLEDFEKWIESSHRKTKPYHEYKIADKAEIEWNSPAPVNEKNPSGNRLVTDERYAELRERMRKKFGSQLNMGVDPEIIAIGTEMAVYHIEKGARKFKAYASAMIADLGDAIRPYLKAFYNAVRDMPEVEAAGFVADMDSYDEVRSIDIANLDKPGTDAMATAAAVVAEQKIENVTKEAERLNSRIDEYTQHLADFLSIAEEDLTEDVEESVLREREALNQELVDYFLRQGVPIDAAEKQSKELLDNIQSQTSVVIARKLQANPEEISGNDTVEKNTKKPSNKKKTGKTKPKSTINNGLFDIAETPTITTPEPRPVADLMGDSSAYQDRGAQTAELVEEIGGVIESRVMMLQLDAESVKPLTMTEVKKMVSKYPALNDISDTDLQELVELAMTQITRSEAIINIDGTAEQQRAAFDHIVNLYQIQPSLNARDSERLIKQQYSTPTPFGFVMGQFVRAGGKTVGSMLEPSAGNGALTITVHPSLVHVNDIDEARLANLRKLGYAQVTAQDALLPFGGDKVDVVMTNPPFGTVAEKVYDGIFHISSLEAQMAINALEKMKDDGRAAIVIGGNTSYRTNGSMNPKDAAFFGYLYSHYNVADVINISGKALYSRNGTGYDVRMILIDGRKTGEFQRVYPPIKAKARAEQVTTFDELYKRVQDDIQQIQQVGSQSADVQREPEATTDGTASAPIRSGSNRPNSGAGQRPGTTSDAVRDTPRTDSGQPATVDDGSRPVGVDNAVSGDAGSSDNVPQPKPQQPRSVGSGSTQNGTGRSGSDGRPAATSRPDSGTERLAVKPDLATEKVPYPNQSGNGFTLMSVVPAAQAQVLQKSLGEIGDVDQYLVDGLGYSSKEELYGYLAAEQIDSVALAIHQMNKGNAFIIGDMTGVGKGRQGAALIRYAVKQGKVPTYFTQKPTLFTDNYRDLADIGSSDLRPLIIASNPKDANIVDADGNIVHKLPSKKEQERVFAYIMEHGTLPDEYDYVLTTYDQIKNGTADYAQNEDGTWNTEARKLPKKSKGYTTADYNGQTRRDALAKLAEGNIAILDESHTVGGDSGCGRYMQMLTSSAGGVTFLSATFAKRADNMPIYAQRTAIAEAEVKASELIDAIMKGGVTLQEIMSKQLVESGQMIRRERSFEGVTIDWLSVEEETDRRQRAQFDEVATIFNAIRNFQDDYITPIIDAKNEAAAEWGATVGHTQGTKDMGVKNVPFASKMYNLVNQLLFALKVDAVADRVVENLRNGYKPVISFTNTMEGFLSSAPKGVAMDEVPNFSLTLMRALDGVMRFTEKDADENTEGGSISLSELSAEGQNAYNAIRDKIMNLTADLPISPMDAIRMKIEEAGYSVAEITGRTMQLNRTEDGKYIVEARKDRDKKAAMRDFNSGKLDVLMINKSGSTGISLHASSKFEDQRQRVMVFAQFQSDINDEVQMRGRIDRSGQVTRGRYEYIMSTIPAEQRIQMMFKAKLKSLDANTTSSQKSKFNEMEIVDYLNKYGDEVVWEYMKEHPELEERLGDPLDMLQEKNSEDGPRTSEKEDTSKKTGCAGKISRYLAFLSVDEQDEIFKEITEAYRVKIQLLDDAGENDLEITTMPLRAETKRKQIWHEGVNPGSGNAFADNTYVEEVEVDVLKKPMKRDEIIEATRKLVGDKGIVTEYDQMRYGSKVGEANWTRYAREKEAEISQFFQEKADEAVGKLREAGEARIAKAREKAVAAATKARGRGENNFTDAEIHSLADTVANEEREKEERKQDKRRSEIMGVKSRIQTLLNRLRAGSIYVVPQDLKQGTPEMFSQTFGTFVGFKFNKSYTLGSSTAIFATLDGRRKVELALSDPAINTIISATEMAYRYSPKEINAITMENWDSNVPTQTRQKRYIITGNLLQALVDTEKGEKTRGNLISYSTIDGETRQGILMGENFKLTDLRNSASLSSRLAQIREGKAVVSENGDVQISKEIYDWRHRGEYELRVPKSKQRGGIYTMHPGLLKLVEGHNFITKGNNMVAYVTEENIANVVDMLSRAPFNLTVLQESQLSDVSENEAEEDVLCRPVTDKATLDRLNSEPTIKVYRAMQLIDGGLRPPMSGKVDGQWRDATEVGAWEEAEEHPEMADEKGRFKLDKGNGKSIKAAYNPYIHTSRSPINDQFSSAWSRPELVTVEVEVPASELTSEYHAEKAKDSVGEKEWKSGPVGRALAKIGQVRKVILSRWSRVVRVVPVEEVADAYAQRLNANGIEVPFNTVPPALRDALAERGVKIGKPEKGNAGKASMPAFEQWIAEQERQRQGDGYSAYTDAEVSFANDPVSKVMGKNRFSKKRQAEFAARERMRMVARIQELAEPMHLDNVEILTDSSQLDGKRATAKGFYNKRTGKITIVIPNNVSTIDAEQTLLHEAVAHYGLRQLFGEQFNTFLDNVYQSADESIRRKITEMAAKNGWDFRTATEEYLAGLAEETNFNEARNYGGWWSQIKRLFLDMLEKIGFEGFRDKVGVVLTDNELRYILWRSYENLAEPGRYRSILGEAADITKQSELKVGNYAEHDIEAEYAAEGDLYRPGDFSPRDQVFARREYERMVSSGSYQFKEAVQDSMLGLKKLYQAILGKGTRIENVSGFENAYLFENRMSSMNAGEQHEYFQRYMQPLLKEIAKIAGADKRKRRELTDYLMAKHGLERNEYMRNEAAANGEETDRDFAGLIGLTGEADWQSAETTAQQWVDDYESAVDTTALWQAINDATKATLEKIYLSGIISKETYEKILGMYQYYIPLRGWNETTSEQVYGYLTSKDGPLGGSIMKKAEGRESMADDPIATIGMMADDAIRQGNRNLMKQRFLNFILNHPSDAVSVHDIWLEYDDVNDGWRPVFADVEATDTADEVAQKVEAFEQRMEALRNAEPDKYKKGREAQHIPYKVVKGNLREHQILIKRNGRTFVATINGNPRAAQALNGLTNPDVDQNGVVGNMLKAGTWINRQLSAFYTTRNPDFVVSNFFRDALYSNCMTWVKESPRYALRFHKNFGRVNPIVMRQLLGKWERGSLDMNNRLEMLFYQFMKNGGETGYTNVRDIEGHKRAVAAELKKQGSTGRKAWSALGMQLDLLNRSAENCARFAAFVTSRDFGRNIDRSIYDAKEISVNFNKKGSGGKMVNANGQTVLGKAGSYLGGGGRLLYVFWNAGIQGFTNFGRQAKLHPAKFTAGATALFALGYVIPLLAQMVGGGDGDDDDKNAYYNLPEYIRRSNICFYAGEQWITIPLPIEYRAMYGMGELAHGVISGNERYTNAELGRQMAAQISQIMPLDMLEGGGGISPFIPSAAKPFTEAYIMNKGWTGLPVYKDTPFNKNEPEWTKAYASADKHLVAFAKWLNEVSGGDDFKKGSIDINPAKIEYLLNGTFGGMFTFPNKIKKTGETIFGDRDFEWRNIPIANRLVKSGDERTAYRKLQNEYFKYKNEYDATGRLMRKYENADNNGVMGYAEKVNFLENSPEFLRYEIFDDFKADIDTYREIIAAESNKEKLSKYETEMYAIMRELVNALNDPRTYFQKIYEAGNLDDEYIKYLETHHGIRLDNSKQK